ncbi:MAG: response regulator [Deltaproteobacteria bacterium]|nr:response regulator [Deltaproteobacteria bacterium]
MNAKAQVLVVEDDPDVADMLTELLGLEGYRVLQAREGREALAMLRGGALPDVILLDLMMPEMNGWQFRQAQLADERFANVPVVVLSADTLTREKALALGASVGLRKPVDIERLLEVLESIGAPHGPTVGA